MDPARASATDVAQISGEAGAPWGVGPGPAPEGYPEGSLAESLASSAEQLANVLIVEDDGAIAQLMRDVLVEEGYRVSLLQSPSQALASEYLDNLRLIIFDYRMNDMDGAEFYRRLREQGVSTAAVLCSAWPGAATIAGELGIHFLRKPFDLGDLTDVVRAAGGRP